MELWKPVVGYEGVYEVSSKGRVRSVDRVLIDRNGREKNFRGQIIATHLNKYGYPICTLWRCGKGKTSTIHRLVAISFLENENDKPQVNHIDGNKENNSIDNLEWVTNSENDIHAFEIGLRTTRRGVDCNFTKLTDEIVLSIRDMKKKGATQRHIAQTFNISEGNVSQIVNRKRWAWLE